MTAFPTRRPQGVAGDARRLFDAETEMIVLGTQLRTGERGAAAGLRYVRRSHQIIQDVIDEVEPEIGISLSAVANRINESRRVAQIGSLAMLMDIEAAGFDDIRAINSLCRDLRRKAADRRAFQLLEKAQRIAELGVHDNPEEFLASLDELRELVEKMPDPANTRAEVGSLPPVITGDASSVTFMREPELPTGAVIALTGDSGSGKSSVATAFARDAIFQGTPCLILDRESPRSVAADRMRRLMLPDSAALRWYGGWTGEVPGPASSEIKNWVKLCDPKPLVIVDSVIAFLGGDENDAAVMRRFFNEIRCLANIGATVIVIGHDGKSETSRDFRGSSDFKAAIDQGFHVTNNSSDCRLDRLVLRYFKSRYGFGGSVTYRYAEGRFVRGQSEDVALGAATHQLTQLLRENPGVGTRRFEDLAKKHGLPRQRARDFLTNATKTGTVRLDVADRNRFHFYLKEGD